MARIDSRGGTAMRDAINMSLDYMKTQAKRDKKVLMVITDGNDNASNVSLERVVARSNQGDTLVYAIGLFTDEERREAAKARRALNELTSATGGLAFYPKDVNEVQAWRSKSRTISGTSTRLRILPISRHSMAAIVKSR